MNLDWMQNVVDHQQATVAATCHYDHDASRRLFYSKLRKRFFVDGRAEDSTVLITGSRFVFETELGMWIPMYKKDNRHWVGPLEFQKTFPFQNKHYPYTVQIAEQSAGVRPHEPFRYTSLVRRIIPGTGTRF